MLSRANSVGVNRIIVTGSSLEESRLALDQCRKFPGKLQCTIGVHPTRCGEFDTYKESADAYYSELQKLLQVGRQEGHAVALGECGLDYDRLHFCDKETQQKYFRKQLELAIATRMPMFLHSRNTGDDFVKIMREFRPRITGGVVHSFTGSMEEMQIFTQELDLFVGVNGCSLKTAENHQIVEAIPLRKLMLETDSPYCDIRPSHASHQYLKDFNETFQEVKKEKYSSDKMVKSRNEPCALIKIAHVVAKIKSISLDELNIAAEANVDNLFYQNS